MDSTFQELSVTRWKESSIENKSQKKLTSPTYLERSQLDYPTERQMIKVPENVK